MSSDFFAKPQNTIIGGLAILTLSIIVRPSFFRDHLPRFIWKKIKIISKIFGGKSDIESYLNEGHFVKAYEEVKLSKKLIELQKKITEEPTTEEGFQRSLVTEIKKIRDVEKFNASWATFTSVIFKMNGFKSKWVARKKTKYDSENQEHEKMLMNLWDLVGYGELEGRLSQSWVKIGFQGEDPATDFRGGGILSLENLIYFAQKHKTTCHKVRDSAQLSKVWYCFAITGINITGWVWEIMKEGILDRVFIHKIGENSKFSEEEFRTFCDELYCLIFVQFDIEWKKYNPKSVMEFGLVQNEYLPRAKTEFAKLDLSAKNILMDYLEKSNY
mmetsp:Transcript_53538/g.61367  ORF Transcript_53538/g.61367 Transcript_53538/m.61367 type:complete len:329 (-) Transcript_53538:140-1126(-)